MAAVFPAVVAAPIPKHATPCGLVNCQSCLTLDLGITLENKAVSFKPNTEVIIVCKKKYLLPKLVEKILNLQLCPITSTDSIGGISSKLSSISSSLIKTMRKTGIKLHRSGAVESFVHRCAKPNEFIIIHFTTDLNEMLSCAPAIHAKSPFSRIILFGISLQNFSCLDNLPSAGKMGYQFKTHVSQYIADTKLNKKLWEHTPDCLVLYPNKVSEPFVTSGQKLTTKLMVNPEPTEDLELRKLMAQNISSSHYYIPAKLEDLTRLPDYAMDS